MGEALRINSGERKGPRGQGIPNGARRRPGQVELEVPGSGEGGTGRSRSCPGSDAALRVSELSVFPNVMWEKGLN